MTSGSELKSKAAMALRAAGYMPCPRLWLTHEQMDLLYYMAEQNSADVNRIRAEAKGETYLGLDRKKQREINLAWKEMKG